MKLWWTTARLKKDIFVIIEYRGFSSISPLKGSQFCFKDLGRTELDLFMSGVSSKMFGPTPMAWANSTYLCLSLSLRKWSSTARMTLGWGGDAGFCMGPQATLNEAAAEPIHNGNWPICRTVNQTDRIKIPFSPLPSTYIMEKPQLSLSSNDSETHGWIHLIPLAQSTSMNVN